jgi:hypothetical protein
MSPHAEQELILLVGGLKRGLDDLVKQRDDDCARQAKEHKENQDRLGSIEVKLTEIKEHGTREAIDLRNDYDTFHSDEFVPVKKLAENWGRWRWGIRVVAIGLAGFIAYLLEAARNVHEIFH